MYCHSQNQGTFRKIWHTAVCHTDNGSQFVSEEYASFAKVSDLGTPHHRPIIHKGMAKQKQPWRLSSLCFENQLILIRHYYTTETLLPKVMHSHQLSACYVGVRAQLSPQIINCFSHKLSLYSDTVCQNIEKRRLSSKASYDTYATSQTHRELEVGDQVYAKPPPQSHGRPWTYNNIVRKNGSRSYTIKTPHSTLRRNRVDRRPARTEPPIHTTHTMVCQVGQCTCSLSPHNHLLWGLWEHLINHPRLLIWTIPVWRAAVPSRHQKLTYTAHHCTAHHLTPYCI